MPAPFCADWWNWSEARRERIHLKYKHCSLTNLKSARNIDIFPRHLEMIQHPGKSDVLILFTPYYISAVSCDWKCLTFLGQICICQQMGVAFKKSQIPITEIARWYRFFNISSLCWAITLFSVSKFEDIIYCEKISPPFLNRNVDFNLMSF